jgi:putative DNA primase/helicase
MAEIQHSWRTLFPSNQRKTPAHQSWKRGGPVEETMQINTGLESDAQPPTGVADALKAIASGWRVHPIGTPESTATADPDALAALWAHDPGAGVALAGMTFDALRSHALAGHGGNMAIADICEHAAKLKPVERDTILQLLHNTTSLPMRTLRAEAASAAGGKADDLALARDVIAETGPENILYTRGAFYLWNGSGVWQRCEDIVIQQHAQAVIERSHVNVTGGKVASVAALVRNETYRRDHTFNLGTADTVNVLNGELELANGSWQGHQHRRQHYRTTQLPIVYQPITHAPLWERFLSDIFRDDPDCDQKRQSLLEHMGYTLMPHANHERFVMLIGPGGNGKSVLLRILSALCGPANVAGVQPHEFANKFQRAQLDGKLANIVTELEQGAVMADAELKAITSGEVTTVEHKFGSPFEMRAFATCWFGTNHMPHTRDFSDALFRRATIFQFNRSFAPHEQDPNLTNKLLSELPAILTQSLVAYQHAATNGFTLAPSSEAAKQAWRMEADQVAQFVQDRCKHDPAGSVELGEVYRHFENWARASGVRRIVGKRAMGDRLERLGFGRVRSNGTLIKGLAVTQIF